MLEKKLRLRKETKFDKSQSFTSPFFVLKFTKNEQTFSRFGFVVSKKIDKRAVVRNRLKRQIRSCIETNLDKIASGYDLLFVLKKPLLKKTTAEIKRITWEELDRQKLLK
jgi:ribonuclease P protein component